MDAYERNQSELFERLLKPHMERLYRFAVVLTRSTPNAEDLFQDVLTKVFGRLDELAALRDPAPWLRRVLYNQFVDHQRRYARRRLHSVSEVELGEGAMEALPDSADTAAAAARLDDIEVHWAGPWRNSVTSTARSSCCTTLRGTNFKKYKILPAYRWAH